MTLQHVALQYLSGFETEDLPDFDTGNRDLICCSDYISALLHHTNEE
jgi:hypothetical protein